MLLSSTCTLPSVFNIATVKLLMLVDNADLAEAFRSREIAGDAGACRSFRDAPSANMTGDLHLILQFPSPARPALPLGAFHRCQ